MLAIMPPPLANTSRSEFGDIGEIACQRIVDGFVDLGVDGGLHRGEFGFAGVTLFDQPRAKAGNGVRGDRRLLAFGIHVGVGIAEDVTVEAKVIASISVGPSPARARSIASRDAA